MPDTRGQARKNRAIRQESLRELLSQQGHEQHVLDLCEKLQDLENEKQLDSVEVQRLKIVIDTKIKLMNKYIPDLKAIEHSGEDGEPIKIISDKPMSEEEWIKSTK